VSLEIEVVELNRSHRRDAFDCGVPALNDYLRKFARQNSKSGLARTYVAIVPSESVVRGYYSLSSSAVACSSLPETARKKLPRYPVPTILIGRLAVDNSMQGKGLAQELLMDALSRIVRAAEVIGVHTVEGDTKDASA
jgi:predicted GNAT family acetyltransferase